MFKKGFTLVEILIVISIIGLMSGLMLPNIAGAQLKAKEAGVRAAMYTIQTALETYNIDNFCYPTGSNLTLYVLAQLLVEDNYLGRIPLNPFSGREYSNSDDSGQIYYSFDKTTNEYSLTAYKADGKTILAIVSNI